MYCFLWGTNLIYIYYVEERCNLKLNFCHCTANYRRDLSSERAPYMKNKESNCHSNVHIWSLAPKGAKHQDELADWPSVVMWLRLRLRLQLDRLCGLVVRVPGYRTEMYCVSCDVRTEFIYYVEQSKPPLWSSGQSSWVQIRRPWFDSRHYQKKKCSGFGTGSTQPRLLSTKPRIRP
jgi:hypothetical protein